MRRKPFVYLSGGATRALTKHLFPGAKPFLPPEATRRKRPGGIFAAGLGRRGTSSRPGPSATQPPVPLRPAFKPAFFFALAPAWGVTKEEWDKAVGLFGETLTASMVPAEESQELASLIVPLEKDIVEKQ